jgi:hypothetical protein
MTLCFRWSAPMSHCLKPTKWDISLIVTMYWHGFACTRQLSLPWKYQIMSSREKLCSLMMKNGTMSMQVNSEDRIWECLIRSRTDMVWSTWGRGHHPPRSDLLWKQPKFYHEKRNNARQTQWPSKLLSSYKCGTHDEVSVEVCPTDHYLYFVGSWLRRYQPKQESGCANAINS